MSKRTADHRPVRSFEFKLRITSMKSILSAAALALACVSFSPDPAAAQAVQSPELLRNSKVIIDYIDPRSPKSEQTLARLKKRQVLEELAQFLSPLRLPRVLRIRTKSCFQANAFYMPAEWAVSLCYEYLEWLDSLAPKQTTREGFTREDVIVGGFIDAVLHEMGHALFDILSVPVFGREEDGADQLSAFIMLQFGKDVARTTIKGSAYTYARSANPRTRTEFSDEHGTAGQRFFNYLCLAYGGDPATFKDFVDLGLLPKARADNCANEYRQVQRAFTKTILPFVDQDMMKQVQARKWLRPEEMK
jgi:hypothetical protein